MSTLTAQGFGTSHSLAAAQAAATGPTTNIVQITTDSHRAREVLGRTAIIKVVTTVGATPTCTYNVQGSYDGTNWFNIGFYDTLVSSTTCLLYTSDAADERSSVDLGGRR